MDQDALKSIEILDRMLEGYAVKIKQLPDNEKLQQGFNELIQVRGTLWKLGKK